MATTQPRQTWPSSGAGTRVAAGPLVLGRRSVALIDPKPRFAYRLELHRRIAERADAPLAWSRLPDSVLVGTVRTVVQDQRRRVGALAVALASGCSPTSSSEAQSGSETAGETSAATDGDGTASMGGDSTDDADPSGGTTSAPTDTGILDCDLWSPDCPPGHKCTQWDPDGNRVPNWESCTPIVPDPDALWEPCTADGTIETGLDSCDAGARCWNLDEETGIGYCIPYCVGSPENLGCPDPAWTCSVFGDGVLPLCYLGCDPIEPQCPSDRDVCVPTQDAFACVPDASLEGGAYGGPCEFLNACDPGLFCTNAGNVPGCTTGNCCSEFCEVGQGDDQCTGVAEGQRCLPWWLMDAPPGLEHVGGCFLPQ